MASSSWGQGVKMHEDVTYIQESSESASSRPDDDDGYMEDSLPALPQYRVPIDHTTGLQDVESTLIMLKDPSMAPVDEHMTVSERWINMAEAGYENTNFTQHVQLCIQNRADEDSERHMEQLAKRRVESFTAKKNAQVMLKRLEADSAQWKLSQEHDWGGVDPFETPKQPAPQKPDFSLRNMALWQSRMKKVEAKKFVHAPKPLALLYNKPAISRYLDPFYNKRSSRDDATPVTVPMNKMSLVASSPYLGKKSSGNDHSNGEPDASSSRITVSLPEPDLRSSLPTSPTPAQFSNTTPMRSRSTFHIRPNSNSVIVAPSSMPQTGTLQVSTPNMRLPSNFRNRLVPISQRN